MGVLDKVKQWFEDEEEEIEEEIVSSKSKVEIAAPPKETEETDEIADTKALQEVKKPASVIFDEKDFAEINNTDAVKEAKKSYASRSKKEKEKGFRPTPIISPVYGILDKNYAKDDVTPKKKAVKRDQSQPEDTGSIDIDWIRRKAYGNLDEDLEKELSKDRHVLVDEKFVEEKELFADLKNKDQDLLENLKSEQESAPIQSESNVEETNSNFENFTNDDKINSSETDEAKEKMLEDSFFYEKRHQEEPPVETNEEEKQEEAAEEKVEKRNNHQKNNEDLFNLVDTMYEKGDDE